MDLAELSVKRPVLVTVFSIIIVLFGLIGFNYLGVREFPSIDPAQISIRTDYAGANADIIESQITEPIEKAINSTVSNNSENLSKKIQYRWKCSQDTKI